AMRAQLRTLTRATRPQAAPRRGRAREEDEDLPYVDLGGRWGRLREAMWSPIGARTPMHIASSVDAGVLTPFVAADTELLKGPAQGVSPWDEMVIRMDPWDLYRADLVDSVGLCAWGTMGSGKTYALQTAALRLIGYGRHVIVEEDPKGEWAALAEAVGGQVLRAGPAAGTKMNPLAAPTARATSSPGASGKMLAAHRGNILRQIVSILRSGKAFTEDEEPCIDAVVDAIETGQCRASIPGVVDYLDDPPGDLVRLVGAQAPGVLHLVLRRLISGPLAGMVDTETSTVLDPASPMICIDTSMLLGADPVTKAIASACIGAWVDALLACQDGRFRIVLEEEAWAKLRNRYSAQAIDTRLRMTGLWRCSNWLIFHELNDIGQMADDGAHRELVRGIISKSPIKLVYRQSPAALALFREFVQPTDDELATVASLSPHVGLWRLGEQMSVLVHSETVPTSHVLFDNSAGRAG
ncbi:hypothetical protein, partial [Occultella aeris]